MTSSNLHQVKSSEHFQSLLSADLTRVSVNYFWAPWAAPCTQMNDFVDKIAPVYPNVIFLKVEAEEQSDIAESFEIESVPSFIILRGHTLLQRIVGADAAALKEAIEKHDTIKPPPAPQSTTSRAPAPPPDALEGEDEESSDALNERLRGLMNKSKVVLFMKGDPEQPRCGFSRQTVSLLKEQGVEFSHFDILTDESVRQGLKTLNNWPTFPQVIINGELVGGLDIVKEMAETGELKEVLAT
jgi:Grx4 family monothiol glutaredoxin